MTRHMAGSHDKQGITRQTWNVTWTKPKCDRDKTKSWQRITFSSAEFLNLKKLA